MGEYDTKNCVGSSKVLNLVAVTIPNLWQVWDLFSSIGSNPDQLNFKIINKMFYKLLSLITYNNNVVSSLQRSTYI